MLSHAREDTPNPPCGRTPPTQDSRPRRRRRGRLDFHARCGREPRLSSPRPTRKGAEPRSAPLVLPSSLMSAPSVPQAASRSPRSAPFTVPSSLRSSGHGSPPIGSQPTSKTPCPSSPSIGDPTRIGAPDPPTRGRSRLASSPQMLSAQRDGALPGSGTGGPVVDRDPGIEPTPAGRDGREPRARRRPAEPDVGVDLGPAGTRARQRQSETGSRRVDRGELGRAAVTPMASAQ